MLSSLRCLLLIEEAFQFGGAHDSARTDLDRLDAALTDQFVEKRPRNAEMLGSSADAEAG
jgi:hypothetical protein